MNKNIDFKDILKTFRKTNNVTQRYVAIKLHVSRQCVSQWETGSRIPDKQMVQYVLEKLGILM